MAQSARSKCGPLFSKRFVAQSALTTSLRDLLEGLVSRVPRGNSHINMTGVLVEPFRGWYILRCLALKGPQRELLGVIFRVLSRKSMTEDNVFSRNWYLIGEKTILSHTHKTRSWYLLRVLSKISDQQPRSFKWESLPRAPVCQPLIFTVYDFQPGACTGLTRVS